MSPLSPLAAAAQSATPTTSSSDKTSTTECTSGGSSTQLRLSFSQKRLQLRKPTEQVCRQSVVFDKYC